MWIEDPDGIRIVLVEVPAGHPLRRDQRPASPPRWRTPIRPLSTRRVGVTRTAPGARAGRA